jgi:hypothetical protein
MRPVIMLDVDDVLNWLERHGHKPPYCGCTVHRTWVRRRITASNGREYVVHLDPANGPRLRRLATTGAADLAWCTSWGDEANWLIGPLLGLPHLPVIPLGPEPAKESLVPFGKWKAGKAARWAAADGRPALVLDNEPEFPDAFKAAGLTQPWKVITVDPATALTPDHLAEGAAWLAGL